MVKKLFYHNEKTSVQPLAKIDYDWVMKKYFEYTDEVSNKFWEINLKKKTNYYNFWKNWNQKSSMPAKKI